MKTVKEVPCVVATLTCCCPCLSFKTRRQILFWLVCLPVRSVIAIIGYLIVEQPSQWQAYDQGILVKTQRLAFTAYCAATAASFLLNALLSCVGWKKEGGFGGPIFWTYSRWLHILLFAAEAVLVYLELPYAYAPLFVDVGIGAFISLQYYCCGGPCSGEIERENNPDIGVPQHIKNAQTEHGPVHFRGSVLNATDS
eukprot:g62522.t1